MACKKNRQTGQGHGGHQGDVEGPGRPGDGHAAPQNRRRAQNSKNIENIRSVLDTRKDIMAGVKANEYGQVQLQELEI